MKPWKDCAILLGFLFFKKKIMKKTIKNFLQFKGQNIYFVDIDGEYWIAYKPIAKILNIDENRCYQNLKSDPILSTVIENKPIAIVNIHGNVQVRSMICIPEMYIYGWVFSLESNSPQLLEYKRECYKILYSHFKGIIIKKIELLEQKAEKVVEKNDLFEKLKDTDEYKEFIKVSSEIKTIDRMSKKVDDDIVKEKILQYSIFE
jgi:hypothetical protein